MFVRVVFRIAKSVNLVVKLLEFSSFDVGKCSWFRIPSGVATLQRWRDVAHDIPVCVERVTVAARGAAAGARLGLGARGTATAARGVISVFARGAMAPACASHQKQARGHGKEAVACRISRAALPRPSRYFSR